MKPDPSLVERAFVEIIDEMVKAKGLKIVNFTPMVWPDAGPKAAYAKWFAIRGKVSNTGKPQGVQISDAQAMANALNEDLAFLMLRASERARTWQESELNQ